MVETQFKQLPTMFPSKPHPRVIAFVATLVFLLIMDRGAFAASKVPSSARSKAAVARVESSLKAALAQKGLKLGSPVYLRIFKQDQTLELWVQKGDTFRLFRTYKICTFSGKLGPKLKEGDRQAPEGFYYVPARQMNPSSRFHLSFNLGYPNTYDRHHGRTGSALMVHGNCVSIGCYAMGDGAIEQIWTLCSKALEKGQRFFRVHCFPFAPTKANLDRHSDSKWISFWRDMKPAYDYFQKHKSPPNIIVRDGRYAIGGTTRQ